MLVTFSSKSYANITMFGDVAVQLLKLMGRKATIPSAMLTEDIPAALALLQAAIDKEKQLAQQEELDEDNDEPLPVSLPQRALPLIDMLKAAVEDKSDIMWTDKS
ncbi:DUF1840 domain-containing protein [Colwellia ponticola]|uniref:DUF1840 domain-containing protein n=1 Tax=Colwellia ponticola TaxID=2304625 RepID=A0A8H2PLF3_9GAMM|nr:DUF1840 domain-containing protein [Colwellia ponticola]TMM44819.1 DUF1840 domain-containing protein [Colwellia ponticola]